MLWVYYFSVAHKIVFIFYLFFWTENEVDGPTLLKMAERMSERLFPKIKEQIQFMSALEGLKLWVLVLIYLVKSISIVIFYEVCIKFNT